MSYRFNKNKDKVVCFHSSRNNIEFKIFIYYIKIYKLYLFFLYKH